jgi:hypothetical protein
MRMIPITKDPVDELRLARELDQEARLRVKHVVQERGPEGNISQSVTTIHR